MIAAKNHAADGSTPAEQESLKYMSMPPQIKPLSTSPIK